MKERRTFFEKMTRRTSSVAPDVFCLNVGMWTLAIESIFVISFHWAEWSSILGGSVYFVLLIVELLHLHVPLPPEDMSIRKLSMLLILLGIVGNVFIMLIAFRLIPLS